MLRILTALVLSATFASVGLAGGHKKDKKAAAMDTKATDKKGTKGAPAGETPATGDAHGDHAEGAATTEEPKH